MSRQADRDRQRLAEIRQREREAEQKRIAQIEANNLRVQQEINEQARRDVEASRRADRAKREAEGRKTRSQRRTEKGYRR